MPKIKSKKNRRLLAQFSIGGILAGLFVLATMVSAPRSSPEELRAQIMNLPSINTTSINPKNVLLNSGLQTIAGYAGTARPIVNSTNVSAKNTFLGSGFETIAGYSGTANNKLVTTKGGNYAASGIGTINALLYNTADYLKYGASALAVLWIMISAFQLVTAQDDNAIKSGKKGITWGLVGLFLMFTINIFVTSFYEGGAVRGAPGASIVKEKIVNGKVIYETKLNTNLVANMTRYLGSDIRQIFEFIKVFGSALAVLFIVIEGFQIVTAGGDEQKIEKSKKYLLHTLTAFITLLMLDQFIFGVIYPGDGYMNRPECVEYLKTGNISIAPPGCASASALGQRGSIQILGLVQFFESLIGGIAVFFIVYAGIRIIGAFGKKETIDKHKKELFWAVAGLAIIVLSHNLVMRFFFVTDYSTGNAGVNLEQGTVDLAGVTNFLASFVGIFALVSLLIAGITWVANFGNSEIATKSKKVVIGAVAGIIIAISAHALVNTLLSADTTGSTKASVVEVAQP